MNWIKQAVINLQKKYKTTDPFELASMLNIHVIHWDLHEEIKGFYKYDKRNKFIYLNNNQCSEHKRFVCTHELGHVVIHSRANTPFLRKSTFFSVDKIELEANIFAVEFLISDESLLEYQHDSLSDLEISKLFGVPIEVVQLKRI